MCVCVCVCVYMRLLFVNFVGSFGFVTFESVDAVERAFAATENQLILDGRYE